MGAIAGLDHTLVGVADLEVARLAWGRLGFTVTPRGRHHGWGTANYCIMFATDYIELLGIVDPSAFVNGLDQQLAERGEGMLGLAFATPDADASARALRDAAIQAEGPKALSRLLELPEGAVEPRFSLVFPEGEAVPGLRAFICQHLTRALVWQPQWTQHANGALSILEVEVIVADPAAARSAYVRLLGGAAVRLDPAALLVDLGGCRLRLHKGDRLGARGFTIAVRDLHGLDRLLSGADIAFSRQGTQRLIVDPAAATGVALQFQQAS